MNLQLFFYFLRALKPRPSAMMKQMYATYRYYGVLRPRSYINITSDICDTLQKSVEYCSNSQAI